MRKKIENILEQCRVVAKNSKCSRRKFGAIITTPDFVQLSNGYNGTIRGALNCGEKDILCLKDLMNEPHYKSYVFCPAVHAEENAVINAARNGISIKGGILFLNSTEDGHCERPCQRCQRTVVNAGITECYFVDKNKEIRHENISLWIYLENEWMRNPDDYRTRGK